MITTRQVGAALALIVAGLSFSAGTDSDANTYKLYFLGGQSNMVGYGYVSELPPEMRRVDRVMIFEGRQALDGDGQGGVGIWGPLRAGYGHGFETDGQAITLSDRFGPELTFGRTLSARLPQANVALVKYARGGTALEPGVGLSSWHPSDKNGRGINQFDHALRTLQNAYSEKDIDGDGVRDHLVPAGIIWMQGEADANKNYKAADDYEQNLAHLVRSLRMALGNEYLPFVFGKITDSGMADDGSVMDYVGQVQTAQARYAESDPCATLVTITDTLNYRDDAWHYDSEGFMRLGEAFADAVLELESNCADDHPG